MKTLRTSYSIFLVSIILIIQACSGGDEALELITQFTQLHQEETGLDFNNAISETEELNYFVHSGFYNGAGLTAGDLDNDGLVDLFFSGNQVRNEVYRNLGDLEFEQFTDASGLDQDSGWCTGATMLDINSDGFLDIYVCRYFSPHPQASAANLLYINNGDLTFSEEAEAYGIADTGNSIQATFFDYDLDGDLDLYVVNQPTGFRAEKGGIVAPNEWKDTDRFYRNENGVFQDLTEEAGVLNFAYGLSAVVGDINNDGYPDIFVSNDYEAPDHLYFNDRMGGFSHIEDHVFRHISNFSMGADIADFNNDGWLDIFVADMLAEEHYRQKANMGAMNQEKFNDMVGRGMHYQYMRNMLHLNNKLGSFCEIGQLAGVSKTDWSWASLFADLDNDGWKDLFITNGILRDVRNNDAQRSSVQNTLEHTQSFPSEALPNVLFKNDHALGFENSGEDWGVADPGFSNGAVYADLDNDGDLDLVTNNVNSAAGVYRNNAPGNSGWLQIELEGDSKNPRGRGCKVTLYRNADMLYQEQTIERGYMSGLSGIMHFGLGNDRDIVKVEVVWPDGKKQTITKPWSDQRLVVRRSDADENWESPSIPDALFVPREKALSLNRDHQENNYNDFEEQVLLPHKLSTLGPGIAVGDINGDGADDVYVGGASGQSGVLFMKQTDGTFERATVPVFEADRSFEDMGVLFLDIDADSDLDLYVVSGGNSFPDRSDMLQDRIYLNDGRGYFTKGKDILPDMRSSGSCVIAADYDLDGDLDLFVGGRHSPGRYPRTPRSYLLENNEGVLKDVTASKAPELQHIGMVSAGLWSDVDNDTRTDLIVVGEWMPVTIFKNSDQGLTQYHNNSALTSHTGWWNSIVGGDFDKDGDIDYVVGNQGLNTKFHVSPNSPLDLYSLDFDEEKGLDIVLAINDSSGSFPVRGRECSAQQMPSIEEKFGDYQSFASATLEDIYTPEKLERAAHFRATTFASSYIRNDQEAGFKVVPLPIEAQFSAVFGMVVHDFDLDGNLDLLLTGNFYAPEVETGRQDAGIGLLLNGDGQGGFAYQDGLLTGFLTQKDARSMALLYDGIFPLIIVGNNNDAMEAFVYINASGKASSFQPGELYAEMHFKDGTVQRIENYLGSGYLSASNGSIQIGPNTEKMIFFRSYGNKRVVK